ncbi:MAG TPA: patatin-like phospholipase family protein [Thermoanaerobaculia bacterium]|nr:patatin-like phospholipase family protein [Thermoanaerobaculia bacterium]
MAQFDIVFEGGGAKGSAFVGALEALHENGHSHRRLIGTSAGAITATLIAAGYTPRELLAAATEKLPNGKPRFSSFMDSPVEEDFTPAQREQSVTMETLKQVRLPFLPNIPGLDRKLLDGLLKIPQYRQLFSLVECGGFFSGNKFLEWIREKLAAKGIQPGTRFKDFASKTRQDLSLVASDTSGVEMLILNHRTAPDCPVEWAVRMSMSIPFVWREVVWKQEWGNYLGRAKTGNIIVDGGVLSNFPIRLIATMDDHVREVMGNTDPQAAGNLGLLIDEKLPVPDAARQNPPMPKNQIRTVQRISRLVDTMTQAQDNSQIRQREKEICRVPALGYGTTEFDMDEPRLKALIDGGRQAMVQHLAQRV